MSVIDLALGSGLLSVLLSVTWMAKRWIPTAKLSVFGWAPLGLKMMLGSVWHLELRSAQVKAAPKVRCQ